MTKRKIKSFIRKEWITLIAGLMALVVWYMEKSAIEDQRGKLQEHLRLSSTIMHLLSVGRTLEVETNQAVTNQNFYLTHQDFVQAKMKSLRLEMNNLNYVTFLLNYANDIDLDSTNIFEEDRVANINTCDSVWKTTNADSIEVYAASEKIIFSERIDQLQYQMQLTTSQILLNLKKIEKCYFIWYLFTAFVFTISKIYQQKLD